MSYAIRFGTAGVASGLSSGTTCVPLVGRAAAQIAGALRDPTSYATTSGGGVFVFYDYQGNPTGSTLTLNMTTLASVAVGVSVFVDSGGGSWRVGTVVSDGSTNASLSGLQIPASAPAAVPSTLNGSQPIGAPDGAQATLLGTASDGSLYFTVASRVIACGSATTVGAAGAGKQVFAQIGGAWKLIDLCTLAGARRGTRARDGS